MSSPADAILDSCLSLAQASSWETFSLAEAASQADVSLAKLSRYYRSKDDLAEALFDRADRAMLLASEQCTASAPEQRLLYCMMSWYDYLAPYQALVKEMLGYKLEPGHIHLQAHGITRISRTVQWFLTAADIQARGLIRITLEIALTATYLRSFRYFLGDDSEQHQQTRLRLQRWLKAIV